MKVINLLGEPSAGKSTLALGLAYAMKKRGLNVELVTEYAKDIVWEERTHVFEQQEYIFAKQSRKLYRLKGKVDYVITDSPLLLSLWYLKNSQTPPSFAPFIKDVISTYDNTYYFLNRKHDYDPVGRYQTEEQAKQISIEMKELMTDNDIDFEYCDSSKKSVKRILRDLGIKKQKKAK